MQKAFSDLLLSVQNQGMGVSCGSEEKRDSSLEIELTLRCAPLNSSLN